MAGGEQRTLGARDWRSLQTVDAYRLLITSGLIVAWLLDAEVRLFGPQVGEAFRYTCLGYALFAVLALVIGRTRTWRLDWHLLSTATLDIAALGLLAFFSSGAESGFGLLLLLPLAVAGLLLRARQAWLLASTAVLWLLLQEALRPVVFVDAPPDFVAAGFVGIYYFIVVGGANWLSGRIDASEALARFSAGRTRRFRDLNHNILEQIQTGAVVVDAEHHVRLINRSAAELIGLVRFDGENRALANIAPFLADDLDAWLAERPPPARLMSAANVPLFAGYARITRGARPDADSDILITLEDGRRQSERANQLKLAAIGRLTASVSHEVRNPLSAISHATDLLAESTDRREDDDQLLAIIDRHVARINDITGRMLGLARHSSGAARRVHLGTWLPSRVDEYCRSTDAPPIFDLDAVDAATTIEFDPAQLDQILTGLWDNATRHARVPDRPLTITLATGRDADGRSWLEVRDNGPGIDTESAGDVLEPFFTTTGDGTGLGLHVARELASANGARLAVRTPDGGACFRLTFNNGPPAATTGNTL